MSRGGKREGAGAKPRTSSPTTVVGFRANEEEKALLIHRATTDAVSYTHLTLPTTPYV